MLQLGIQTQVTMVVSPWNEVINDVFVDLQFSGVEENTAALLQSKLPELQKQLEDVLQGSSADASDWAGGVLRRLVREKVEAELPEFRAAVDVVREDRRTVIQVVVYPVGQLVQSIDYEMVSQSIPNLLLLILNSVMHRNTGVKGTAGNICQQAQRRAGKITAGRTQCRV